MMDWMDGLIVLDGWMNGWIDGLDITELDRWMMD